MQGQIAFYDEPSAWGLIRGHDGLLYGFRGSQVAGPAPRVGERVAFDPLPAPGGPRAAAVRRSAPPARATPPVPASPARGGPRP
jgi:cold shock CspA family protein